MSDIKRIRVRVTGRVQGVYFRASTQAQARALGLSGWVRNTDDGAVELEAQGLPASLAELVRWCHRGPSGAHVVDVQVGDTGVLESDERNFRIIR